MLRGKALFSHLWERDCHNKRQCKSDNKRQWTLAPGSGASRNKWALWPQGEVKPDPCKQHVWSCTPSPPHAQNEPDVWVCIPHPSNLKTELHFQKNLVWAKLMRSAWLDPAPGQQTLPVASDWHGKLRQWDKRLLFQRPRGVHVRNLSVNCFSWNDDAMGPPWDGQALTLFPNNQSRKETAVFFFSKTCNKCCKSSMPPDSAKKDTFRILEFKLCKMCNSIFQTPTCGFRQLVKPGEHCFENKGICCTPLRGKACRASVSMCDRDAPPAVELQNSVPCVFRRGIREELLLYSALKFGAEM